MQDPDHLALFDGSDDLRQDGDLHNETGIQAKASLSAHGCWVASVNPRPNEMRWSLV